jgi:predicted phage gp36 major capsid-like protein
MTEPSQGIFGAIKDMRQVGSLLAAAPAKTQTSTETTDVLSSPSKPTTGKVSANQISVDQEKWEKDIVASKVVIS